jgi:hypothetical protein
MSFGHYVEVGSWRGVLRTQRSATYMHYTLSLELCLLEREREREKGRLRTGSTSTHTLDRN